MAAPGAIGETLAVTVYSRQLAAPALLLRHPRLDAAGNTLSVVGAKSAITGRAVGDKLVVRLPGGGLVIATITHIHHHDRYRAAVGVADLLRAGGLVPPALRTAEAAGDVNWVGPARATPEAR